MERESADAEVYFPDEDRWLPVFSWRTSGAAFNAGPYRDSSHLRAVVNELAKSLGASIVDDEGNELSDS